MKDPGTIASLISALALVFFPLTAVAAPVKIVAFGDSLTAGYQLRPEEAFPARLEAKLKAKGHDVQVINAGISGETTAGGLARVASIVAQKGDIVILELGANDMLRQLPVQNAMANLDAILAALTASGAKVLLTGMVASPFHFGAEYANRFNAMYGELAKKYDVALYPHFLEGVAGNAGLNLPDRVHPNARGADAIAERIAPEVEKLLKPKRFGIF